MYALETGGERPAGSGPEQDDGTSEADPGEPKLRPGKPVARAPFDQGPCGVSGHRLVAARRARAPRHVRASRRCSGRVGARPHAAAQRAPTDEPRARTSVHWVRERARASNGARARERGLDKSPPRPRPCSRRSFIDRGQRIESRFSLRPIRMSGRIVLERRALVGGTPSAADDDDIEELPCASWSLPHSFCSFACLTRGTALPKGTGNSRWSRARSRRTLGSERTTDNTWLLGAFAV